MNDVIRNARETALGILQPSQRDLEYGLGLHRDSLVIDAYGFSPRCAVDGQALAAAFESGSSDATLRDLAEEMSMTRCAVNEGERREYLMAWEAAGVTGIFQNAGEESQAPLTLLKRLARFTYVTDTLRGQVCRAVTAQDVLRARELGQRCL
ncbi:MAG: dipeptidase, partial [Armatimonadota bacterium]|nr:dipeptidase [Armatimonadota bacterium]